MSEEAIKPAFSDVSDPDLQNEGRIDSLAVLALILGVASSAALLNSYLWGIAGVALLVGAVAFSKASNAARSVWSRRLALTGLVLSIVFAVWAPTHYNLRRWRLGQQASAVGEQWIRLLLSGQADDAFVAQLNPVDRPFGREPIEKQLLNDEYMKVRYEQFLQSDLTRALKNLGARAHITLFDTENILPAGDADTISNIYAVSYLDGIQRKSFFVRVVVERMVHPVKTTGFWRVKRYQGGIRPRDLKTVDSPNPG